MTTAADVRSTANEIALAAWSALPLTDWLWLDRLRRLKNEAVLDDRVVAYLNHLGNQYAGGTQYREYDENNRLKERE